MKRIRNFVVIATMLFASSAMFTSCIKDEALNAEADIENATIENASTLLQVEPTITNNKVTFKLKQFTARHDYAPEFVLTEGATIEPASGTTRDFETPQKYTVTSQDGMWKKEYTVEFVIDEGTLLAYTFENVIIDGEGALASDAAYHKFFDYSIDQTTKKLDWDSGNNGFSLIASGLGFADDPTAYPTAQTDEGYIGKAAVLVTRDTGFLGSLMKAPIAAGNLYLGDFVFSNPPIESTHFGKAYTYSQAPKSISGHFKYSAGEKFKINNAPSELDNKDVWDAYAILFEKRENDNFLTGSHNFEDARMVSVARLPSEFAVETDEWTPFSMSFEYIDGKHFDSEKEYMFTIVFSSSKEGARFNGAVGSSLYIDEVQIDLEPVEVE